MPPEIENYPLTKYENIFVTSHAINAMEDDWAYYYVLKPKSIMNWKRNSPLLKRICATAILRQRRPQSRK